MLSAELNFVIETMETIIRQLTKMAQKLNTDDKNEILNEVQKQNNEVLLDAFKNLITILDYFE
jgi:hypothetical protein